MGTIKAVCISEKKGTPKTNIKKAYLEEESGIINDAHRGPWHRQISLLSYDSVRAFEERGQMALEDGAFGENLLVEGIDLCKLPVGTKLQTKNVELEVTQIGKECHHGCAIKQVTGDCIMPREGIFARVLKSGWIEEGDEISIMNSAFRVAVVTVSDSGSKNQRVDESGKRIVQMMEQAGYEISFQTIIPDEREEIKAVLIKCADEKIADLILTTGGTGFSKRDVTPEATQEVIERLTPGIPEAMRQKSMQVTDRAMLSRATAGIRGDSLIINLPGSPKAVKENLEVIMPVLDHGLEILLGLKGECARK